MLNGNYRPIDFIVERLYRNSIIFQKSNVTEYDLAEYIGEALLLIGAKPQYQDNFELVTINDHRGKLVCSPVSIEGMRTLDNLYNGAGLRKSTDTFAGSPNLTTSQTMLIRDHEYVSNGQIIQIPTMKDGIIEIKYQSLVTDDRGYPMIPDDERYAKATEAYVKYMVYRPMWEIGEIRDRVYLAAEQDWLFYVTSAKTKALMPNVDGMESIKNSVVKLLRDYNTRGDTGRSVGASEERRGYNIK
jgi:hypothetical protein